MHKQLSIICEHLFHDQNLPYNTEVAEPIDETDSGLVYFCKSHKHNFQKADGWLTVCLDCFPKTGLTKDN